jgi:3-hydroxypropanoate dehydrogenase
MEGSLNTMLDQHALEVLFLAARTHRRWLDKAVPEDLLKRLYGLLRMGPTASNGCPARIVFVASPESKVRLKPCLDKGNVDKAMSAPVTAIVGYDSQFYELFPRLNPGSKLRDRFANDAEASRENAVRNGTLQGGYFIIAARALGLDCGPMSGFDRAKVDAEFFPEGRIRSNFLCNLGYGSGEGLRPRGPRLDFDEACSIV